MTKIVQPAGDDRRGRGSYGVGPGEGREKPHDGDSVRSDNGYLSGIGEGEPSDDESARNEGPEAFGR
jgi:hypothetical protein